MNIDELIALGNQARADRDPNKALEYYTYAMAVDRNSPAAFNNYGNVLRECGEPEAGIPFLLRSLQLDPNGSVANFNLAVAYLLAGDYSHGWPQYETRWKYEHLDGVLPKFAQPRWQGEDLNGKKIFILSEQGHGDTIQFVRFVDQLKALGAIIILHADANIASLFPNNDVISQIVLPTDTIPEFDYWTPIMSIPGILKITLDNLNSPISYIRPNLQKTKEWLDLLGPKYKLRIGFCWSGRRDTWINLHKAVPFEIMYDFIKRNPQYEWVNLQIDCTDEESARLAEIGVRIFPNSITCFADTAALLEAMDVVIGVDTSVVHLAGAMGRPTWLMLNWFGQDWRWLLNRDSSPWYPSTRIFRQPGMDQWQPVVDKIEKFLTWFKI